jgi:hypothetical protein
MYSLGFVQKQNGRRGISLLLCTIEGDCALFDRGKAKGENKKKECLS